jgi:hypothetical protein
MPPRAAHDNPLEGFAFFPPLVRGIFKGASNFGVHPPANRFPPKKWREMQGCFVNSFLYDRKGSAGSAREQ